MPTPRVPFVCNSCGGCCRRAAVTPGLHVPTRDDGACVYLQPDNRCAVYEQRPIGCRVDDAFDAMNLHELIDRARWHDIVHAGCNEFMREDGGGPLFVIGG